MIALALPTFIASLLGSPHCAGMCGPFVCFYNGADAAGRRWVTHLAYNGGRLLSYLALGVMAGLLGSQLDQVGQLAGVSRLAALLGGTLMVVWGGVALLRAWGIRVPGVAIGSGGPARWMAARLGHHPPVLRAALLGSMTTLLPCGWLYAFVALAAGTGSVAAALVVMLSFWLGTLPMLATVGVAAQHTLGPLRRHLPAMTAALVLVIGLLTVTGRIQRSLPPMDPARITAHDRH